MSFLYNHFVYSLQSLFFNLFFVFPLAVTSNIQWSSPLTKTNVKNLGLQQTPKNSPKNVL